MQQQQEIEQEGFLGDESGLLKGRTSAGRRGGGVSWRREDFSVGLAISNVSLKCAGFWFSRVS
jgi:hypothetical protein